MTKYASINGDSSIEIATLNVLSLFSQLCLGTAHELEVSQMRPLQHCNGDERRNTTRSFFRTNSEFEYLIFKS